MCSTIGIYFNITNIKLGFSIFKAFVKFIIKLHLHFVLEWVNLICTCQPSNALQHYVMATNTFCLNFFTHRAGPHVKVVLTWAQIAIGTLYSGITHERCTNFDTEKKKKKTETGAF